MKGNCSSVEGQAVESCTEGVLCVGQIGCFAWRWKRSKLRTWIVRHNGLISYSKWQWIVSSMSHGCCKNDLLTHCVFPTHILNANFIPHPSGCCKLLPFSLTSPFSSHCVWVSQSFFGYHHLRGDRIFDRKMVKFSDAGGVLQEVADRCTNWGNAV